MKILGLSSPIRKKRYQCCTKQDPNEKARTVCENFFGHLKNECLELHDMPKTNEELIRKVDDYIDFYNTARPQRKLKGMTPVEFRMSYLSRGFS